jgi:hypothetical protein
MKKIAAVTLSFLVLLPLVSGAGVSMDLVTKGASGQETGRLNFRAQSDKIRMDDAGNGSRNSMIFLGDSFIVLDHKKKNYIVMDEAFVNEVSAQMNDAMQEMEKQLAGLPPEQRAMAEQMMKGQMAQMMGQQQEPPAPPRVESMGAGSWQDYDCEKFAVFEKGEKTQELCAAGLDDIDGAAEMMQAFRGMAKFMRKMMESMPMRGDAGMNPGELMDQIEGFPVHTIEYSNGAVVGETSLESVTEQDLDDGLFVVPDGYEREDPMRRP